MVALQMRQSLVMALPALPCCVHALSDPGDTTTGDVTWRLSPTGCFFFFFGTYVTLHGAMDAMELNRRSHLLCCL